MPSALRIARNYRFWSSILMRAEFNKTFKVRYGSRSLTGTPGVVWAEGVPGRRVVQRQIEQGQFVFELTDEWLTTELLTMSGPRVMSPWLGAYYTDQLAADEVCLSDEPDVWYSLCRVEEIDPEFGATYRRYLLLPLANVVRPPWPTAEPLPPNPGEPGVVTPEPGASCASPAMLPGYGIYTLATQPDGSNGYYALELPPGSNIRVQFLDGVAPEYTSDFHTTVQGGDCCSGTYVGQMGTAGEMCVSVGASTDKPMPGRLCFSVASVLPPFGMQVVRFLITNDVCPPP